MDINLRRRSDIFFYFIFWNLLIRLGRFFLPTPDFFMVVLGVELWSPALVFCCVVSLLMFPFSLLLQTVLQTLANALTVLTVYL